VAKSLLTLALLLLVGCRTQRTLQFTSDPVGAEVRLDDVVVGVTPLRVPFEHYGTRRVAFYLPGYRSESRRIRLRSPWHARFPFDLVTEVLLPLGLRDRRKVHQVLIPGEEVMSLPSLRSVIERASALRQAGPEGPRDLPETSPAVVPSEFDEPHPPAEPEAGRVRP
jgi:hypothetical protein